MLWRKKERQVIESLRASASAGRLSDLEKQAGCSSLVQFIRVHPVREDTPFHLLLTKKYMFAAIAIILAVALSGGVTYAAEGALPGDALYPIKVRINEEVRAALATSAEADADWDARRVERRLEEAAVLAATGELDAETRVHLEERFAVHAERVKARVEKLEQAGKVEQAERVFERLAVSLQVHERILDEIIAAAAGTGKVEIEVKPLVRKIRAERRASQEHRAAAAARVEAKAAVEIEESDDDQDDEDDDVRESCRNKIQEAERFIARADLSVEARTEAEDQLREATVLRDQGDADLSSSTRRAFILFGDCQRAAQEAKALAQVRARLRAHLPAGFKLKIEFKDDNEAGTVTTTTELNRTEDEDEDKEDSDKDRRESKGRGGKDKDEKEKNGVWTPPEMPLF